MKLRSSPACACGEPATEVDHLDGDPMNMSWDNLDPKCKSCHSRKTVTQDRGFGRPCGK